VEERILFPYRERGRPCGALRAACRSSGKRELDLRTSPGGGCDLLAEDDEEQVTTAPKEIRPL
jgi:hypothetical protein